MSIHSQVCFRVLYIRCQLSSGGSMLEPGGHSPPPNLFQGNSVLLLVIGSIVISLSRCCLPNDEGLAPPPNIFFL